MINYKKIPTVKIEEREISIQCDRCELPQAKA